MNVPFLKDIDYDLAGRTVLVRAPLNVPMDGDRITDWSRLEGLKQTVDFLRQGGARILLVGHLGRPKGTLRPELSLKPIAAGLEGLWNVPVQFAGDILDEQARKLVENMTDGDIAMFENLRFHTGEEQNDAAFAERMAELADVYVNDSFPDSHRAHASVAAVVRYLPAYAGFQVEAELSALDAALANPGRPACAVIGGAKISTKMDVLGNLVDRMDHIILGGGMANTFLMMRGHPVGKSLAEPDWGPQAEKIMREAGQRGCEIHLPIDVVIAKELSPNAPSRVTPISEVPEEAMILDIGPETIVAYARIMQSCKTCVWNGPMGAFETEPFHEGTIALAERAAGLTRRGELKTVAGGGDTLAALARAGVQDRMSYVSTAGGAFLEWLEGKDLPGIKALEEQTHAIRKEH